MGQDLFPFFLLHGHYGECRFSNLFGVTSDFKNFNKVPPRFLWKTKRRTQFFLMEGFDVLDEDHGTICSFFLESSGVPVDTTCSLSRT
jgi:hypothetical protein